MPYRRFRTLFFICAAFWVRGVFYCIEQPLWEGFDEWAHFAFLEHLAAHAELPERTDEVPAGVRQSLLLAPLSGAAAEAVPGGTTHQLFWQLPAPERLRRMQELGGLRAADAPGDTAAARDLPMYEAQQPPLYYVLLLPVYVATRAASLPTQVLLLRVASLTFAVCLLPLAYLTARELALLQDLAEMVALLLASAPSLYVDVCRVGNDSLAIVLCGGTVLCAIRLLRPDAGLRAWAILGGVLTAALLTKAYALALVPLLPLVAVLQIRRRGAKTVRGFFLAVAMVACGAGWWYVRAWNLTGSLSGEQVIASAAGLGIAAKMRAIGGVRWWRVADSVATAAIWVGGWSFLGVRSWMYRVFEILAAAACAGVVRSRAMRGGGTRLFVLAAAVLLFCAGLAYYALSLFATQGASTAPGWYLFAVSVPGSVLLACGFRGLLGVRAIALMVVLALALDLYAMHFVLLPYYAGLIAHRAQGPLAAFHLEQWRGGGFAGVFERMGSAFPVSYFAAVAVWVAYLAASFGLIAVAFRASAGGSRRWRC